MSEKQNDLFGDIQDDSILEHLDDDSSAETVRFPALLTELNTLLRGELTKHGVDPRISLELVYAISCQIGGMQIYIPRGQTLESLIRDMKIWRDFNGRNITELVERYCVTYKTVYKAIRRMRKLEQGKRQLSFNME
ncbi:Mor transcription activator family protein [Citrobacter portucalensis]|uniref:Mor transcription activator family protein n=1 Tax=Citrobacter portucalensis TaxID=1639133 RepID=UPI00254C86E3|nr:Mor transcription activator family protein [Citrobacter portucalensis]